MQNTTLLRWLGIAIFVFSLMVIIIFVAYLSYLMWGDPTSAPTVQKPPLAANNTNTDPSGVEPAMTTVTEDLAAQSNIKKFESADELREFLDSHQTSSPTYGYLNRGFKDDLTMMPELGLDFAADVGLESAASVVRQGPGLFDHQCPGPRCGRGRYYQE